MTNFQLSVIPGLGGVAAAELLARTGFKPSGAGIRLRNAEILTVAHSGNPKELLGLRTVEDVFIALGRIKLSGQTSDMKAITSSHMWNAPLRAALGVWSQVTGNTLTKRQVFRVVVQADDAAWRHYRRNEIALTAERVLLMAGSSWRLDRDVAPLEIWLQQSGRELLVSVRLSTGEMRSHGGREVERGAALRPTLAAAMVQLTKPTDQDVFLDPMCGTGTILLERALFSRYGQLLGGDNDAAAVKATLANFGPRHQPRSIERWDATKLPLDDASVNAVACNLPWGRQVSEQALLPALYLGVLRELERVVVPGGRIVLLTSEWDILKRAIRGERDRLRLVENVSNVEILGRRADIFVIERV